MNHKEHGDVHDNALNEQRKLVALGEPVKYTKKAMSTYVKKKISKLYV